MTEMVNDGSLQTLKQHEAEAKGMHLGSGSSSSSATPSVGPIRTDTSNPATPPHSGSIKPEQRFDTGSSPPIPPAFPSDLDAYQLSQYFVVDSFNIHRLVIAGVTCASKFFSDVFYTNSRYAKVSGLPNRSSLDRITNFELGRRIALG